MAIEVVIPWLAGSPQRKAALEWVCRRYEWPVTLGPGGRPWVKADAVMPAVERSAADIVVVADADCWCDGTAAAVEAVEAGARWAVPHGKVHRLTEVATAAVLGGLDPEGLPTEQRPYLAYIGGGIVVARREVLLDVPLDPRFIGWGSEDSAWGCALTALAGRPWRGFEPLYHLWHPPQDRLTRVIGSEESEALRARYLAAARMPKKMRPLIEEIATWLDERSGSRRQTAASSARPPGSRRGGRSPSPSCAR